MSKIFDDIVKVLGSMLTDSANNEHVRKDTVYRVTATYKDDDDSIVGSAALHASSTGRHGVYSTSQSEWVAWDDSNGATHLGPAVSHDPSTTAGRTNLANIYIGNTPLVDVLYPVGAIYMSTEATSPDTIWGGTWEQIPVSRTLISAGSSSQTSVYLVNEQGGAATKDYTPAGTNAGTAITVDQMPSHSHGVTYYYDAVGNSSAPQRGYYGSNTGATYNTGAKGGGKTHTHTFTGTKASINVMQPWYAVYMWRRTA